ncbi:MAG: hypothetical protein AA931_11005 [Peptococcaceae bacterium 1109]|jgi:hypothetical protein|nr:MAG: hypothetical protein AA931_11005 [Peptococcaceae bacterium 1109]
MKKRIPLLAALLLAVVLLAGCDTSVLIRLDQPIIIELPYRTNVDGYISYRGKQVRVTSDMNTRSSYRALEEARITLLETGQVTWTDRYGYFQFRGVPGPDRYITLKIEHWRLPEAIYTSIYLR